MAKGHKTPSSKNCRTLEYVFISFSSHDFLLSLSVFNINQLTLYLIGKLYALPDIDIRLGI